MASFSMEEFVGNGVLKGLLPKLVEEGWDDVPTLKIMNSDDMNAINMTQEQKGALEIRSYLHDRSLLQYGDKLESSGKSLPELLNLSAENLSTQFGMKRGHIARFIDRTSACTEPLPKSHTPTKQPIKDGYTFKGIVAAEPGGSRAYDCVNPPPVVDKLAPYSALENISVQKLTPEYKIGMEGLLKAKAPPMKASELWRDRPAVLLCIRRPGCIMCRAEAHQLYSKKPIFDALGIQLIAVLHEHIESEVKDFWPRYWGGAVIFDRGMGFFKALGGGELLKEKFLSGFIFNPEL
ncbi:hypothetical protein FNV43_RR26385 [Rhamnella rubrinervis]|uniref:Peroxiredoxin-like 2A n=1 Tax=Rhamnella rubrinervis TaxID=2594499 RepID=A0A8K0DNZ5_9ROSA|nr:hypothetical protein FNV43_RR26385 [Rhamnella rubrinervis]